MEKKEGKEKNNTSKNASVVVEYIKTDKKYKGRQASDGETLRLEEAVVHGARGGVCSAAGAVERACGDGGERAGAGEN